MSVNLYVISTQDFTGKSAVCVALLKRMQTDGFKVGYLKPFSSAARLIAESRIDEDARFVKQTFDLPEPIEALAPVVFSNQNLRLHLTGSKPEDYAKIIRDAATGVEQGRDVVVMEGSANFREGYVVGLAPSKMVELLDAQVVAVVGYRHSLQVVDDALTAKTRLGDRLKGIIINMVPGDRTVYIHELVIPYLAQQGIKTLAMLPHQSILSSLSVGEINDALEGKVICYGCYNDLVENLVVASMGVEHSLEQFRRVKNKAVIVGADRPDIQMDALDTSTKALVLTGDMDPAPQVVQRAEVDDVAIIMSSFDTLTTIERLEQLFERSRFTQVEKVRHFETLLNDTMDFDHFYRDIGLI
ncbi:MAG: phosphotransacetylase family protein [Anaerolineae bacterium]